MANKMSTQVKLLLALVVLVVSMITSYPHIRDWAKNRDTESSPGRLKDALKRGELAANSRRYEEADEAYREALELIIEARAEDPDNAQLQKTEINVLDRLLGIAESREDHAAASEWSIQALESAETHFDSRPTHTHYRRRLLYTSAKAFEHSPRPYPGNVEVFKASLKKVEATDKDVQAIWLVRKDMVGAWKRIAAVETEADNAEGMAFAIREGMKWSQPTENTQEPRIDTLKLEADVIQKGRTYAGEKKLNSKALEDEFTMALIEVRAQQARLEPYKVRYQIDLGLLRLNMAKTYRADTPEKAEKLYKAAVDGLDKASEIQPGDVDLMTNYIRAINLLGKFYSDTKRNQDALDMYRLSYERASNLPESHVDRRLFSMANYAVLLMRLKKTNEARAIAQEAYDLASATSAKKPDSDSARIDTAEAGLRLARYLKRSPNRQRKKALGIASTQAGILDFNPPSTADDATPKEKKLAKKHGKLKSELRSLVKELRRR